MDTMTMAQRAKVPSALNILFSLWLIASAFLMNFMGTSSAAFWDAIIVGMVVLVLAWFRENNPASATWPSWVNAVLGVWMIISPFLFGLTAFTAVMWDFIIVGVAFLIFGVWSALATQRAT